MSATSLFRTEIATAMAVALVLGIVLLALRPKDRASTRNALLLLGFCAVAGIAENMFGSAGGRTFAGILADATGTRIRDEKDLSRIDTVEIGPGAMSFAAPHPAGGARMGGDPRTSVVGFDHRVHGTDNLFVADPSAFPTPPSVDPSLTIMAWSSIAARHVARAV